MSVPVVLIKRSLSLCFVCITNKTWRQHANQYYWCLPHMDVSVCVLVYWTYIHARVIINEDS